MVSQQVDLGGTGLQWVTLGLFMVLVVACVVMVRRRPDSWAYALAIILWAANNIAFYVIYLVYYDGALNPLLVQWSVITRWHSVILVILAMVIVTRRRNGDGY